ncbi:MAG: hypothetical protein JSV65_03270 [Armatimonadota bacterium]|nr:MAG: hypothetical protein JSV65_03270 [Armatimonadota bacterium]
MTRRVLIPSVLLVFAAQMLCAMPQGHRRKIILWGAPTPGYIREHTEQIQQMPVDGIMLTATYPEGGKDRRMADAVFSNRRVNPDDFRDDIAQLRATDFGRLTDNFLLVHVTPGDIDWFGDCSAFMHNARVAARIAREAGLKGLVLDCEPYGFKLWDYREVAHPERSFEDYRRQIRLRGEEFARAVWGEFPDQVFFLLFGYYMGDLRHPEDHHYGLLPPFLDGLFAASPGNAVIVDGWEASYTAKTREEFLRAYWWIHCGALPLCAVPDEYRRKVSAGFGIWPDPISVEDAPFDWDEEDFSRNYRTPEGFKHTLISALDTADEYIWIFSGRINWWSGEHLPGAYRQAMVEARDTLLGFSGVQLEEWARWPSSEAFARDHELIAELAHDWKFRLDLYDRHATWYDPKLDDSDWLTVKTDGQWYQALPFPDATGTAWGRVAFDIPAEYERHPLHLWFGALDEGGEIYLNGTRVGEWNEDFDYAWQTPFAVDITDAALPGGRNLLAVKVRAESSLGGVFRPVYLYTTRR